MRKFKNGDKVRVCSIPPLDKNIEPTWCSPPMDKMCGKEYTVFYRGEYISFIENDEWVFNELWLEHVNIVPIVKVVDMGML